MRPKILLLILLFVSFLMPGCSPSSDLPNPLNPSPFDEPIGGDLYHATYISIPLSCGDGICKNEDIVSCPEDCSEFNEPEVKQCEIATCEFIVDTKGNPDNVPLMGKYTQSDTYTFTQGKKRSLLCYPAGGDYPVIFIFSSPEKSSIIFRPDSSSDFGGDKECEITLHENSKSTFTCDLQKADSECIYDDEKGGYVCETIKITSGSFSCDDPPEPPDPPSYPIELVAYYKFDEGEGDLSYDSTENANTAYLSSASWSPGVKGSAVQVYGEGSNSVITVSHSSSINLSTPLTLSAFVNLNISPISHRFIMKKFVDNEGYQFWMDEGVVRFVLDDRSVGTSTPIVNENMWTHVAVVWDGLSAIFYLNGEFVESVDYDPPIVEIYGDLKIGFESGMLIDELMIFNSPLTDDEIYEIYNK